MRIMSRTSSSGLLLLVVVLHYLLPRAPRWLLARLIVHAPFLCKKSSYRALARAVLILAVAFRWRFALWAHARSSVDRVFPPCSTDTRLAPGIQSPILSSATATGSGAPPRVTSRRHNEAGGDSKFESLDHAPRPSPEATARTHPTTSRSYRPATSSSWTSSPARWDSRGCFSGP
jgi:hypothetical protein